MTERCPYCSPPDDVFWETLRRRAEQLADAPSWMAAGLAYDERNFTSYTAEAEETLAYRRGLLP